jgi:hypothetical protein
VANAQLDFLYIMIYLSDIQSYIMAYCGGAIKVVIGWVSLFIIGYIIAVLFYVHAGTNKVLKITAAGRELRSEATEILTRSNRARFLWVKQHRSEIPVEARKLAKRVTAADHTCWATLLILFIIYGLQFVL